MRATIEITADTTVGGPVATSDSDGSIVTSVPDDHAQRFGDEEHVVVIMFVDSAQKTGSLVNMCLLMRSFFSTRHNCLLTELTGRFEYLHQECTKCL